MSAFFAKCRACNGIREERSTLRFFSEQNRGCAKVQLMCFSSKRCAKSWPKQQKRAHTLICEIDLDQRARPILSSSQQQLARFQVLLLLLQCCCCWMSHQLSQSADQREGSKLILQWAKIPSKKMPSLFDTALKSTESFFVIFRIIIQ